MKRIISLIILLSIMLTSCGESKTFCIDNKEVEVHPYGWMNTREKVEGVNYKIVEENIFFSVILCETIIAPILLTGLALYEPYELQNNCENNPLITGKGTEDTR